MYRQITVHTVQYSTDVQTVKMYRQITVLPVQYSTDVQTNHSTDSTVQYKCTDQSQYSQYSTVQMYRKMTVQTVQYITDVH